MKGIRILAITIATVVLVASCQQVTSSTTNNNTTPPKKLMIDLPKSLTGASAAAGLSAASGTTTGSSGAYFMIHTSIGMTKTLVLFLGIYGTMIDAVIAQNSLTPSADTVTGKSVTVTQAMLDQMKASIDTDLIDATGLPAVGATLTLPDFVYNTSSNANFTYCLAMPSMSTAFYWTTDRSRFGMSMDMAGMTMTIANDTTTNSMALKIVSGTSFTYSLKFKADADATNHGVFVGMDVSGFGSGSISGYADDLGGAASYTITGSGEYVEEFDSAGNVTYQGGSAVTSPTGTPSGTYSTKTSATQTWGNDATTLFS